MLPGAGRQMDARENRNAGSGGGTLMPAPFHNLNNMNANLNKEISIYAREHSWQKLLRALPAGEPIPLVLDSVESLNNLRSVAARLNSMGQDELRYSFSGLNYETRAICALATQKNNGDD